MDTSYLTQQVTSIIGQLHNLFDEIGVPHHERDSRESELFSSLSETLHNHLKLVSGEKNELVDECQRIMTTITQMETSLDDAHKSSHYAPLNEELKITYPLLDCLHMLKNKHKEISKLHKERYEQVKKLVQALVSYSSHLEASFVKIKLPPVSDNTCPPTFDLSPSYIDSVDREFSRVYDEYGRRVALVQQLGEEVVNLWAELGTPQAQTDSDIVRHWRDSPEQLGLHQDDVGRLQARRDKLVEEKRGRERRLNQLRTEVEGLWIRLGVEDQDRKAFLATNRGCGLRAINDLEDELSRLNELKRQNLHLFVEDARNKLQALWDELYFSEEEAVEFTPMFSDIYSDALLSAHETEISRLEALKEQRAPILSLIEKHRSLLTDKADLESTSHDASRLMMKGAKGEKRDPGKLLREEKMRKRITRELPKVSQELQKVLEAWEDEYGRPFLVFGDHYLETLSVSGTKASNTRSKTPNGIPPRPASQAATRQGPSKNSNGTLRTQPNREPRPAIPPRSKTPATAPSTLRGNPASAFSKPVAASGNAKSPSRIPARVPLGQTSGNSPERKSPTKANSRINTGGESSLRGVKSGSLMAPPPKMRELQPQPPTPASTASNNLQEMLQSGSVVRNVQPEDPYAPSSYGQSQSHVPNAQRTIQHAQPIPSHEEMPPPPRPYPGHQYSYSSTAPSTAPSLTNTSSSRLPSGDSSAQSSNGLSGSENWETYGSDDEEEGQHYSHPSRNHHKQSHYRDAYQSDIRTNQSKRAHPDDSNFGAGKKLKAFRPNCVDTTVIDSEGRVVSESAWTDDDHDSIF